MKASCSHGWQTKNPQKYYQIKDQSTLNQIPYSSRCQFPAKSQGYPIVLFCCWLFSWEKVAVEGVIINWLTDQLWLEPRLASNISQANPLIPRGSSHNTKDWSLEQFSIKKGINRLCSFELFTYSPLLKHFLFVNYNPQERFLLNTIIN
jgi:hypothetical protein